MSKPICFNYANYEKAISDLTRISRENAELKERIEQSYEQGAIDFVKWCVDNEYGVALEGKNNFFLLPIEAVFEEWQREQKGGAECSAETYNHDCEFAYKQCRADAIDECITEIQRIGKSSTEIKTHNLLDYIIRHFEQLKEQNND